jgi:hypothetical protein
MHSRKRGSSRLRLAGAMAVAMMATAYVPVRTTTGRVSHWSQPSITLAVYRPSKDKGFAEDRLRKAIVTAAEAWSYPAISCTSLRLNVEPLIDGPGRVQPDGRNVLVFRDRTWCSDEDKNLEHCHDPSRVAITTVYDRRTDAGGPEGEILEADLEINAVDYTWALDTKASASRANERHLSAILVHELGHMLGLAHSCASSTLLPMTDDRGSQVPLCRLASPEVRASVMYPDPEEEGRPVVLTPTADEKRAICEMYPRQGCSGRCTIARAPASGAPESSPEPLVLVLSALIGVALFGRYMSRLGARS